MKNTLFLGNGLNLTLYKGASKWTELYTEKERKKITNNTLLYEACFLQSHMNDNGYKTQILNTIKKEIRPSTLKNDADYHINTFAPELQRHNIDNIITTNVDNGIEFLLTEKNGFVENGRNFTEKIYSIRRNIVFSREAHNIIVWKIHGDIDFVKSMSFGFDQYCGSLSRIENYFKGTYKSSSGLENTISIEAKCDNTDLFDNISWIELFFKTNVYIAGFGLDFSEIDIWWLLNKRKRLINDGVPINNEIVFLYSQYDDGSSKKGKEASIIKKSFDEKKLLLDHFGVKYKKIETGANFIPSIFSHIY